LAGWQWVAETEVTLSRPAKPSHLCPVGKRKANDPLSPGVPVQARRVLSQVLNDGGDVLAQWLLLTNVKDVDAATIALWYYWRLPAGHKSALAIAKRLLVASMACVTVWSSAAQELQRWVYGGGKVLPGLVTRRQAEAVLLQRT